MPLLFYLIPSPTCYIRKGTYIALMTFSKIVCEVVLDVFYEFVCVLRVKAQDLKEPFKNDALKITVGQCLHVSIGLDHLVFS